MRKQATRFISVCLIIVLLGSLMFPAVASADVEYDQKSTFWHWIAGDGSILNGLVGYTLGKVCPESEDGYHHASSYQKEANKDGYYYCICTSCGREFIAYASDLQQSYDDYVQTLPAQSYTSSGGLTWQPTLNDFDFDESSLRFAVVSNGGSTVKLSAFPYEGSRSMTNASWKFDFVSSSNAISASFVSWNYAKVSLNSFVKVPFSGNYRIISSPFYSASGFFTNGAAYKDSGLYSAGSFSHVSSGELVSVSSGYSATPSASFSSLLYTIYPPVFEVIPDTALSGDTYNINTRPTSITGGNYGIVGDNGQITKVEDNSTIINETNNTFYNPATGTTVPIVNWSYDYSDRSYKVTLESGDTATITYGDENITIQETTITEGDTITNNYTIYYLIDGSGSENPPSACDHAWTETSTPATCTLPGSKLLTCSKCQQTKTETLPALGHDWQVKQTVTTQYDDTGQLIQQGYTIFECSRCKEQYKSPDGTIPPGGSGSGDSSGDDDGGNWFTDLLKKIGEFIGSTLGALLELIGGILTGLLDTLISLVISVIESLSSLVDLFGSFGEALGVIWTWLPSEIMTILVAGVSIFVLFALLKIFLK